MTASVLELKGIMKRYKNFCLGPLDLRLEKGTVVALLGTNSSGKSTLFRLIMSIVQAEKAEILFNGEPMTRQSETGIKQRIGYVGDQYDIMGDLTIKELASLVSYWYPNWSNQRYANLLKRYQIDEKMKYSKCSKGTQKKVQFVLALSHEPDLLLLDEPSAGVDIVSQRKMKEDILEYMTDEEHTVFLATHIIDEVKQICDFIYVIDEGQLIYFFEKDEVHSRWARLWLSHLPEALRNHPNVLEYTDQPVSIVTDDLPTLELELSAKNVTITHTQRLQIDEVVTFILESADAEPVENY